ncbi:glycosyltransferase [Pseudidiomarina gelatinasegens]|uniref:Glycosyltransferase n=1 Tax=Pseudidiomarina gelatinasegens TaxID=2487740 RepID=A0A443Z7N9_9GAMM|nr:glycosyltransferase [Pseudidiomarina gelatinasegens]RWU12952.1 glycosyltransferase [Pseudidiomarina gelatinasegens]
MKDGKISVVIATYNGEKYLKEQLISILNQSVEVDEIIISDDNSSDRTLEVIGSISCSKIKVIKNNNNVGYKENFNIALSHAGGNFIFLCDQDDSWVEDKVKVCMDSIGDNLLLMHDIWFCNGNLKRVGDTKLKRLRFQRNLNRAYATGMAMMIKKELVQLVTPIPSEWTAGHDNWFNEWSILLGRKVIINNCLADYRRHESTVTFDDKLNQEEGNPLNFISSRSSYDLRLRELENYNVMSKFIDRHRNDFVFLEDFDYLIVSNRLNLLIDICKRRLAMTQMNLFYRFMSASTLLLRGRYRFFNGILSFMKDLRN